jgi:hypothetical protein
MNFDDLQQQWKDEPSDNVQIPTEIDVLRKAITPIDKLRKKMKRDFIILYIVLFGVGFGVTYLDMSFEKKIMFCIFFSIIITFNSYYSLKFFKFYKTLNTMNLSSRKNLERIYTDFRININLYKSQNFHIIYGNTMLMLFNMFVGTGERRIIFINEMANKNYQNILIVITIMIATPILAFISSEWYGGTRDYKEHFSNIEKLIDELDEL